MSLDVYLIGPEQLVKCRCRDCEHEHERMIYPTYFSDNITHNLARMASEAGIYEALWHPERLLLPPGTDLSSLEAEKVAEDWLADNGREIRAEELISKLEIGLGALKARPTYLSRFNPCNGWGDYGVLVDFVTRYIAACREHPQATVRVSG